MGESVVSITSAQLAAWLGTFLWPFLRILALVSAAPVTGDPVVPRRIRVAIAAMLALALAPALPAAATPPALSIESAWVAAQQVLVGVAMGFAMRLVFAAVQGAGEAIGLQMGLSFASFFDASSGGQTVVVSRLLNLLALLLFLAFDGHLHLIALLARSFEWVPVGAPTLAAAGWLTLVRAAGEIFATGLMLGLPLVTALLILNLAMGILNRSSPQFSIFAIGFPLTLLAGLAMLSLMVPQLAAFLEPRFDTALQTAGAVVRALRP